jgi:hypothetical protein
MTLRRMRGATRAEWEAQISAVFAGQGFRPA